MKQVSLICLCFTILFQAASQNAGTASVLNYIPPSPLKASVHLNNNTATTGTIEQIIDSVLILSILDKNKNSIAYSRSIISIKNIKFIKIKRKAFWLGMMTGGVATGFAGYYLGRGSYNSDLTISDEENQSKEELKGVEGALIGAVPGAIIGSVVGSIVTKRKFIINGDIKNMSAMLNAVKNFKSQIK